jgi:uncharacterized membrane protein
VTQVELLEAEERRRGKRRRIGRMSEQETETLQEAHQKISKALELLMEPPMHTVPGIREVREAVVAAKNAVGRLISGDREPFR